MCEAVVTVVWDGSDFERDAKELTEYRPRWRDGFKDDAGVLGFVASICISGAIMRYGEGSDDAWMMALIGFICIFTALAQRRVLVEAPVWLVSAGIGRLPMRVLSAANRWSDSDWRDPKRIARELLEVTGEDARFGVTFRRIGVARCYVGRALLPKVRATDWRDEFEVLLA